MPELTGQMIFESQPHRVGWKDLSEDTRTLFESSAATLNEQFDTIRSGKKKVLLFILQEYREEVSTWGCDEIELPDLTPDERLALSMQLREMQDDLADWDGSADEEFSEVTLIDLAMTWLGEPYRYARKKGGK